jgi:hypothetical protein
MAVNYAEKRAEQLKAALKTGHSTVPAHREVTKEELNGAKAQDPAKAQAPKGIWCKACYQFYPETAKKDFICRVCPSREYLTVPPY